MIADLTKYFGWDPVSPWNLTQAKLDWWLAQAKRQIAAQKR